MNYSIETNVITSKILKENYLPNPILFNPLEVGFENPKIVILDKKKELKYYFDLYSKNGNEETK